MARTTKTTVARGRRHARLRKKVKGTTERPRLSVFKSNTHLYAQVIDDAQGKTVASACTLDKDLKGAGKTKDAGKKVGTAIAERAKKAGVSEVVFDRGGFQYHGVIKALADAAREGGLKF